jgi:hypothetical protein
MPATTSRIIRRKLDLGTRRRKPAKIAPENTTFRLPENIFIFRLYLMKNGIKKRDVTPVSVREIAAPSKPRDGTRIKREKIYCTAAPTINIPDNFGFPMPINMEERVYPNIRRDVPIMRI